MHGASNSTTLVITAGLAMVTAASFLLKAETEKKNRMLQESEDSRRRAMLKRQSSTASRSKRDRAIETEHETPPVVSIGVPTTAEDSCPAGVLDTSFETRASSDASSCDELSMQLESSKQDETEWKGMHAFVFVAIVWALCVFVLPIVLGIKSLEDVLPQDAMEWIKIAKDEPVVVAAPKKWWQLSTAA